MNMLTGDLSWIEKQVSKFTFETIKHHAKKHQKDRLPGLCGLSCDFYVKLFECSTCNTVETHNDIVIKFDDKERYQVEWNCSRCDGMLRIATKPINEYACKKCGCTLLIERGYGV